jgi:hypothetical protein
MKIDVNTTLKELFEIAKNTINEVEQGEEFIVKELFRGIEWNRIAKGNRTKLGAMFFSFSENEGNGIIVGIGKTPQNQQKYRKL